MGQGIKCNSDSHLDLLHSKVKNTVLTGLVSSPIAESERISNGNNTDLLRDQQMSERLSETNSSGMDADQE